MSKRTGQLPKTPLLAAIQCEGKKSFDTQALAAAVVTRANRSKCPNRTIYRCSVCRKWHMGTDQGITRHKANDRKRAIHDAEESFD